VRFSACVRGEDRPLGDGKGARDASALFIVFEAKRTVYVSVVRAGAPHGRQDDSVLQIGVSNADGLE
jgi:hypothetical protein